MNEGVTPRRGDGQAVRVLEITDDALDVLEGPRLRALANVGDDLVALRLKAPQQRTADESGGPCDETAHAALVTGSPRRTSD
jgi:hypothetical protein